MDLVIRKDALDRLKTIQGHARGIQRMVEEEQYCIDILRQIAAVQKALDRVSALLLQNHLESCVTTAIRSPQATERERVIQELLEIFKGGTQLVRKPDQLDSWGGEAPTGQLPDPSREPHPATIEVHCKVRTADGS